MTSIEIVALCVAAVVFYVLCAGVVCRINSKMCRTYWCKPGRPCDECEKTSWMWPLLIPLGVVGWLFRTILFVPLRAIYRLGKGS